MTVLVTVLLAGEYVEWRRYVDSTTSVVLNSGYYSLSDAYSSLADDFVLDVDEKSITLSLTISSTSHTRQSKINDFLLVKNTCVCVYVCWILA